MTGDSGIAHEAVADIQQQMELLELKTKVLGAYWQELEELSTALLIGLTSASGECPRPETYKRELDKLERIRDVRREWIKNKVDEAEAGVDWTKP